MPPFLMATSESPRVGSHVDRLASARTFAHHLRAHHLHAPLLNSSSFLDTFTIRLMDTCTTRTFHTRYTDDKTQKHLPSVPVAAPHNNAGNIPDLSAMFLINPNFDTHNSYFTCIFEFMLSGSACFSRHTDNVVNATSARFHFDDGPHVDEDFV